MGKYTIDDLENDIAKGNGLKYFDLTPRTKIVKIFKKHASGNEITKNCIERACDDEELKEISGMSTQTIASYEAALKQKVAE